MLVAAFHVGMGDLKFREIFYETVLLSQRLSIFIFIYPLFNIDNTELSSY